MRLNKSRIEPLEPTKARKVLVDLFGESTPQNAGRLNITRLWAKHPDLMFAQRNFQKHIFETSTLTPRLREIAILRIGWLCKSGYELAQHAVFGKEAGLNVEELKRVTEESISSEWTHLEATVICAVDEMFADAFITTETWTALSEELNEQQLLDLLCVVGRYWGVSVLLNSTGLQLEESALTFEGHLSEKP